MTVRMDWRGDLVRYLVDQEAKSSLRDAAEFMLEEANRTVPIEEGTLARSGNTDLDGLTASVYYDTPYAARQHEEATWNHAPGRRSKWLQLAAQEQARRLERFFADRIRKAFR